MQTRVSGKNKEVVIEDRLPTVLIGERINPTGRKKLAAAVQDGNLDLIRQEALDQVQAGADILDINVGVAGLEEEILLPQVVQMVMDTVDVPLSLDSASPEAIEAALKVYQGKALINSVTGEEESLQSILPLVRKYGSAVIGLSIDERGIPPDANGRLAIARKIVERAEAMGIPREDILIDCVAQSVGADEQAGRVTLEAIQIIKAQLHVNLTLGASNLSFGLPDRHFLNNAFLAMAIAAGVNCPIVDVAKTCPMILASDLILGRDKFAMRYIRAYKQRRAR